MNIYDVPLYKEDIRYVASLELPWEKLQDKSIVVSGATGMIGSFLIDVIMYKNLCEGLNCKVFALGRNEQRSISRFAYCQTESTYSFIKYDINLPFVRDDIGKVDLVIHLASNTHPVAYATDPIGTITTNIIGTQNMLDFALAHDANRCVFASSNEIYGENRGDIEKFHEKYAGYIDCNTLRAGYPESKRCGEALCQAYISQKGLDIVIPRITRSYGPTLLSNDTKALSQFLHKGVRGEDIVLKSEGTQYYSYLYVSDTVAGIFTVMFMGNSGEAYNIADENSDIRLKDLAWTVANHVGSKVVFEIPDAVETAGYSKATKARLDNRKIISLGWTAKYDIKQGVERTIDMLRAMEQ